MSKDFICSNPDCSYKLTDATGDECAECPKCGWWLRESKGKGYLVKKRCKGCNRKLTIQRYRPGTSNIKCAHCWEKHSYNCE